MPIKKIIVELQGGLGNQLFQYAHARQLQIALGSKIIFFEKKSFFKKISKSNLQIKELFGGDINVARNYKSNIIVTIFVLRAILIKRISKFVRNKNFLNSMYCFFGYISDDLYIDIEKLKINGPRFINVSGYYMSPKWFSSIEDVVRSEVLSSLTKRSSKCISSIDVDANTIAIHVRGGDYLDEKWRDTHYICNALYFKDSIDLIKKALPNKTSLKFMLITEDRKILNGLKKDIGIEDGEEIHINSKTEFDDLLLIAKSKSAIISNSTFSWWGVFLSNTQSGVVVAPSIWHKKNTMAYLDLYRREWLLVKPVEG